MLNSGGNMKEPIYLQVANKIEDKINNGSYKIKERLPSERSLAEIYAVSRMTARQAVSVLEEKGVVYREKGSGTYVQAPIFQQNNVKSFTRTVGDMGYKVSTRVLEFSRITSLKAIAKILDMPETSQFYKVKRLRLGNNIPMALEILYIPIECCPGLDEFELEQSLYQLLEDHYDIKVSKVSYKMEAVIANPIYMKLLELKKTTALLKVTGITLDHHNTKFMYEESLYRSDLYNYLVDINRKF